MYSGLLEGECINVEEGLTLEGEIVKYSNVSLSPTLDRNEKVEQHIRKKIRKPNALRFWVKGGVIPLYVVWLSSHCLRSPQFSPWILPTHSSSLSLLNLLSLTCNRYSSTILVFSFKPTSSPIQCTLPMVLLSLTDIHYQDLLLSRVSKQSRIPNFKTLISQPFILP